MNSSALTTTLGVSDPRTRDRIREHTPAHVIDRIDTLSAAMTARAAANGRDAVVARLKELDYEWDADRALVLNFAIIGGLSSLLGERSRGWKAFFRTQQVFLFLHAVVGWCPPTSVFRRLGFRTQQEIGAERLVLRELLERHDRPPQ
jgi:hypothetical protein